LQLAKHVTYRLYVNATSKSQISVQIAESCSSFSMKGIGAIVAGIICSFAVVFGVLSLVVDRLRMNFENFVADNKSAPNYWPLHTYTVNEDDASL